MVITDILLEAEIANVTVNDTGQYTVDGLRSGVAYSFELFVALEDLQLYGQNSSSTIGVTLLGKLQTRATSIMVPGTEMFSQKLGGNKKLESILRYITLLYSLK